jgi:hypothetical protein
MKTVWDVIISCALGGWAENSRPHSVSFPIDNYLFFKQRLKSLKWSTIWFRWLWCRVFGHYTRMRLVKDLNDRGVYRFGCLHCGESWEQEIRYQEPPSY